MSTISDARKDFVSFFHVFVRCFELHDAHAESQVNCFRLTYRQRQQSYIEASITERKQYDSKRAILALF